MFSEGAALITSFHETIDHGALRRSWLNRNLRAVSGNPGTEDLSLSSASLSSGPERVSHPGRPCSTARVPRPAWTEDSSAGVSRRYRAALLNLSNDLCFALTLSRGIARNMNNILDTGSPTWHTACRVHPQAARGLTVVVTKTACSSLGRYVPSKRTFSHLCLLSAGSISARPSSIWFQYEPEGEHPGDQLGMSLRVSNQHIIIIETMTATSRLGCYSSCRSERSGNHF